MIETKEKELEQIESEIMTLEIEFNPRASTLYKNKWTKRIEELRERRKIIKRNIRYRFKK